MGNNKKVSLVIMKTIFNISGNLIANSDRTQNINGNSRIRMEGRGQWSTTGIKYNQYWVNFSS